MKPMYVRVVQTLVSGGLYKHWFQLTQLTLRFGVAQEDGLKGLMPSAIWGLAWSSCRRAANDSIGPKSDTYTESSRPPRTGHSLSRRVFSSIWLSGTTCNGIGRSRLSYGADDVLAQAIFAKL
jgi:hypothetical protein